MDDIPPSEFDGRNFDAREFVQRYRKRLPLKELQKSLRSQHAATRQELVELINEKYADFVSLSSRMQGVERALKPLRAPLEESSELTRSLHTKLGGLLSQAEEAHSSVSGIRSRKEALALYIQNAKLLDQAKAAAGQRWGNPQESDDFLKEYVMHESVARDLRRIRLNLGGKARGVKVSEGDPEEAEAPSAECAALLEEAAAFETVFAERLRERLHGLATNSKRALSSQMSKGSGASSGPARAELLAVAHLCRALVTLGRTEVVEGVFTNVFARGVVDSAAAACASATEDAQRQGADGAPTGGSLPFAISFGAPDLGPFFDSVKAVLLDEGAPLLWLARCLRGAAEDDIKGTLLAVPSLHLVANVAVMPVLQHVQQAWPNVFTPAPPDIFAANYTHAASFVRAAQALMAPAERLAFAQHPALADFQRRWKTQVYSSLRAKEATHAIEASAAKAPLAESRAQGGGNFWLEASVELVRLIQTVWSDQWCLDVVYSKMLQLTLELLARYGKIVQVLASSSETAGTEKAWDTTATTSAWTPASLPVRLSRAAADVYAVLSEIACATGCKPDSLASRIVSRAPEGPNGRPAEITRTLLQEADEGLRPVLSALEAAVLAQVSAVVTPQFASVKGIPALFRVVDRPVPTKASAYVEPALRPIQSLLEVARANAPADVVAGWVQRAVDAAAVEFSVQATQLIESTQQQQASLQRLADRTTGGTAVAVSNFDKMHIQLCLDVESFTAAAAKLGVPTAEAPGLQRLAEAVSKISSTLEAHRIQSG